MSTPRTTARLPHLSGLSWDDCRLLVESVADYAIFMLDAEGHIATWNLGAEKIKGYAPHEIIGHHFSEFYPEEDVVAGKPERELKIAADVGRVEDEGWRVRKDGTRFWANVVITALRDETGHLRGYAKVTRDLTEKRRAEETLRRSEERFRLLVEGVTDYAIYMLDTQGHITTWNVGAQRMKGYRVDEVLGRHFSLFFPAEDVAKQKPEIELEIARTEGRFEEEGWRARKDGSLFWASVVLTAVRSANGTLLGFGKVTRDLTARRAAEDLERTLIREQAARVAAQEAEARIRASEELARDAAERAELAARQAQDASRVKDEFLATVSHELRTPLNAILGWSSLLVGRAVDPSLGKGLDAIHRNARAQARLIEDILDVSRVITGKLHLDPKRIDVVATVKEAIDVVRPSLLAKRITLDLQSPTEPVLLVADSERIRQVVWNLLSNAVKFTESGGRIDAAVFKEGSSVVIEIRDSGVGIEQEFLPYVFDRFRQADSSTTRQFGGLGLGLAIVRHIVELHGGQVSAESGGRGHGATMRVSLPMRAMSAETPEAARGPVSMPPSDRGELTLAGMRVLVVDDDSDARELLELVLVGAGADVATARSSAEGLERVQSFRPDVLVSDIGMPGEDGYAFARRVRDLEPTLGGGIPAVALTAYTRSDDREKALASGFVRYVAKPVDPRKLITAVASLRSPQSLPD